MTRSFNAFYLPMPGHRGLRGFAGERKPCPIDGPNGWFVPTTTAHFNAIGVAAPDYLFPCSEASGDLVATIGSLTLTKTGTTQLYQQSVSGWSRPFVGFSDDTTATQNWLTSSTSLDLALNESFAMVLLSSFTPQASGGRSLAVWSTTIGFAINLLPTSGIVRSGIAGTFTAGTKGHGGLGTVHQYALYRNCALGVSGVETDLESIVSTSHSNAATTASEIKGIFGGSTGVICRHGLIALWKGVNAERNWQAMLAAMRGG